MATKKNILLISFFWTGIRDFFLNRDEKFKGMPAFTNTFMKLVEHKNVGKVYVLFLGSKISTTYHIPVKYQTKLEVYGYSYSKGATALWAILNLGIRALRIVVFKKIYLIYGHGPTSGIAGIISLITRIPNIRRIYGTFFCDKLQDSKTSIFRAHPLEYLAFSLPAKAIVITNDGTKGDLVHDKIGHRTSPLHFWLNGIDKFEIAIPNIKEVGDKYGFDFSPDICYIARIDKWKRQHLLLDALKLAKDKGQLYNTVIAGPVINQKYYDDMLKTIQENGLGDTVKLIPGLTKTESLSVIKYAKVSTSFYDFSNLGNVFLESLSLGTPMLTENINGSLDLIESNVYYNTTPSKPLEVVKTLETIFKDEDTLVLKSKQAVDFSHRTLLTWDERADKELELLEL